MLCDNACSVANDGICQDGGTDSKLSSNLATGQTYSLCGYGNKSIFEPHTAHTHTHHPPLDVAGDDCVDCLPRHIVTYGVLTESTLPTPPLAAFPNPPPPPNPPAPPPPPPTLWNGCSNTCGSNGMCEDGGAGSYSQACTLGTDCDDCGYRADSVIACEDSCRAGKPSYGYTGIGTLRNDRTTTRDIMDGICDDSGEGGVPYYNRNFIQKDNFGSFNGRVAEDHCAFGTDCADCGERLVTTHPRIKQRGAGFAPSPPPGAAAAAAAAVVVVAPVAYVQPKPPPPPPNPQPPPPGALYGETCGYSTMYQDGVGDHQACQGMTMTCAQEPCERFPSGGWVVGSACCAYAGNNLCGCGIPAEFKCGYVRTSSSGCVLDDAEYCPVIAPSAPCPPTGARRDRRSLQARGELYVSPEPPPAPPNPPPPSPHPLHPPPPLPPPPGAPPPPPTQLCACNRTRTL